MMLFGKFHFTLEQKEKSDSTMSRIGMSHAFFPENCNKLINLNLTGLL